MHLDRHTLACHDSSLWYFLLKVLFCVVLVSDLVCCVFCVAERAANGHLSGKTLLAVEVPPKEYFQGITALEAYFSQCKSLVLLGSPVITTTG